MSGSGQSQLIFALDVPDLEQAESWVARLAPHVGLFKVGLELFIAAGPDAIRAAYEQGAVGVFLDLKLHDIPTTVGRAARSAGALGVRMLTVHAQGGQAALEAAVNGAGPEGTTALMSAAQLLQLESVQWLLENGSTAGKEKALGLASMFINPDEKTQQIIKLLTVSSK